MPRVHPIVLIGPLLLGLPACKKPAAPPDSATTTAGPATAVDYDIARLAADLKSQSPGRRETAIRMSAELDAQQVDVVPTLLEALKDPAAGESGTYADRPTSTREAAVLALLRLKDKGKKALAETGLKSLEQGLTDAKPNVREHTASAIGLVGPDAQPAAAALTEVCADPDRDVRSASYRALQKLKSVPPMPILKLLTHTDLRLAADAAAALAWIKPTGPDAVTLLLAAVKREPKAMDEVGEVVFVRNAAAEALAGAGTGSETAIPVLVDLIVKATVADVERAARPTRPGELASNLTGPVLALRRMGKPAVGPVVPLLKHEQPVIRYQAAAVLSGIGPEGAEALPAVQEALEAERGLPTGQLYVFEELAAAALNLGGDPQKVASVVAELLTFDDEGVRIRAAAILARIGRTAGAAVPKLAELLNDKAPEVQLAAAEALAAVGPAAKTAIPELAKKVEAKDDDLARAAIGALRALGPVAAPAVPSLAKAIESDDRGLSVEAAQALAAIGPAASPAVPTLAKQLGNPQMRKDERLAILLAVAAIGKSAAGAVPAVIKLLGDKDPAIRVAAAETFGRVGVTDPEAASKLSGTLGDAHLAVRIAGLKALAAVRAKTAAPDIKRLQEASPDPAVKVWTAAALVALGSDEDANQNAVLSALKDRAPAARIARLTAMDAVELLGAGAKVATPELIAALKDRTPVARKDGEQVRGRAARALGRLGAKEAIPPLTEMLRDPDRGARRAAAEALGLIGPDAVVAAARLR
ncbi:MAG TPA: HEAT repeat domain-containing protein, partial [Gemmataceae bacterium]|nr:HEAT repeat domain-containing protein [Gemmataceae bacterium]